MKEGSRTIAELSVQGKKERYYFRWAKSHLLSEICTCGTPDLSLQTAFIPYTQRRTAESLTTWEESNLSVGPWVSYQGLSGTQGHRKRRDCVAAQVMSRNRALCFKCFSGRQSLWDIAQHCRLSLTWSQAMDVSPGTVSYSLVRCLVNTVVNLVWEWCRSDWEVGLAAVLWSDAWCRLWSSVWCQTANLIHILEPWHLLFEVWKADKM